MAAEAGLTCDGFLGGRLRIWQPTSGYRAGADPVLLAAAVRAKPGDSVLELGLGVGTASLCLGARVPGLALTGVELQPEYAALARRNAAENGVSLEVIEADLRALPPAMTARSFDHVLANPPFFRPGTRTASPDAGREAARAGEASAAAWVRTGIKRLNPGGTLVLIQAAARLPELLAALPSAGVTVQPLAAREGRASDRVIVTARKGSRAGFRLLAPLILHSGAAHSHSAADFAPWAEACLRGGQPLPEASTG